MLTAAEIRELFQPSVMEKPTTVLTEPSITKIDGKKCIQLFDGNKNVIIELNKDSKPN